METAVVRTWQVAGRDFSQTVAGKVTQCVAGTLVVALAAHCAIPLWFTPVPLTLQPLAVVGVGMALGPWLGFMTMLLYLAEGAMGLPVFTPMLMVGVMQIVGPTGGYLMAYPVVAAIAGGLTRSLAKYLPRFVAAFLGCNVAFVVLLACGAGWLMHYTHGSAIAAWSFGVAPFLGGEFVKVLVAAGLYSAGGPRQSKAAA